MAFNPERLSLVVEPIGGVGLRWFNYQTDESEDDLIATDYLPDAEKYGLRLYDLIFVSPTSGTEEPYILTVDTIDASGNATLVNSARFGSDTLSYRDKAAVGRIRVPASADNILVSAYDATVNPSAGRANYRAASDADYAAVPALLRQTDAAGRKFIINEKKFSLDMAGAPNDGTGDSSAAFDAVFDLIKTEIAANGKNNTRYVIDLAGGIYRTTSSLDFTNFTGWNVGIVNGMIIGACAGKPVIDASGGRGYFFDNLFIWGDVDDRPSHGIICPRATVNQYSGSQEFGRLTIDGYFTEASFYAYGMEGALMRHCMIFNRDFTGRVAIFEGYDEHAVTSDYATPLTGSTSFIWNTVLMTNFRHLPVSGTDPTVHTSATATAVTKANPGVVTCPAGHPFQNGDFVVFFLPSGMTELRLSSFEVANATATTFELSGADTSAWGTFTGSCTVVKKSTSAPVYLARASGFYFDRSYIVAWGQPHIELGFPDSSRRKLTDINLDLLYEGAGNQHNVLFSTGGAVTCDVHGLKIRNYNANAKGTFLSIEGGGTVRFWDSEIKVYDAIETVDLCDQPADMRWYGVDIAYKTVAATGYASVPAASAFGTITDLTTGIRHPLGLRTIHPSDGSSTTFDVQSSTGTITTVGTKSMTWKVDGEYVDFEVSIAITTNGTGGGAVQFAPPLTPASGLVSIGGSGRGVSGAMLQCYVSTTWFNLATTANAYPGADGATLRFSGRYRRAV